MFCCRASVFVFFFGLADNSCFIFRRKGKESFFVLLFLFFELHFKVLFFLLKCKTLPVSSWKAWKKAGSGRQQNCKDFMGLKRNEEIQNQKQARTTDEQWCTIWCFGFRNRGLGRMKEVCWTLASKKFRRLKGLWGKRCPNFQQNAALLHGPHRTPFFSSDTSQKN